ncbi:TonB-dependent hemoglobin/transferrin/lactoferrin family receptor [Acanthopleuribacter pedis]|uniref:TonB-dependent hemoglobin/transferrin/lactoferrin family receptor n=1 Tax=Acanthopleuribacter pedis TaxID=442870 RepID=A0A8J7U313_9BACT|nr:TonB-dependent hemoglobin/transferrin/lactoferrin family receptor [Acanthopleuribacter pedis]MBO1319893.1 TonB-dependent hemoglobin/transferrin/lactoferrin family receptor [Acanthopleuribacter pedis]
MKRFALWACQLCMPLCLWAAETPAEPKQDAATLLEHMTVVAERAPTTLNESPSTVTVVNEEQIQREVMTDSSDLIRYEPGVTVDMDPERLGLNGFRIRGVGANRVHTQIDGVRTAEEFGFGPLAINQYQIDVDLLKSMEIVKSAGSSLYGSDALGGVVAFQTIDPEDLLSYDAQAFNGRLKTGYDTTTEQTQVSAAAAWRTGAWSFLANATFRDGHERDNQGDHDSFDAARTTPNPIDTRSRQFLLKGVYQASPDNRWKITAEVYQSESDTQFFSGQGTSEQFGALLTVADFDAVDEKERLRLSLTQQKSGIDALLLDGYQWQLYLTQDETTQDTVEQRRTQRGPMVSNVRRNGSFDLEQEGLGLDITMSKNWGDNSRLTYGFSANETNFEQLRDRTEFDLDTGNPDAYSGTLVFPTRYFPISDVREIGAYVQWQGHFFANRVTVTPGVRYDRYEVDPDENDRIFLESTGNASEPVTVDDSAVTPKLGAKFQINEWLSLNGLYAEGFRAPPHHSVNSGFTNLAGGYQTLPNGDLEPESSRNLEFGLRALWQRFSARLTHFDNRYEDFIQDTAFAGVGPGGIFLFQPQNLDNVDINGWEMAVDTMLAEQWRLRAAYTDIDSEDRATGAELDSIDPSQGVLGVNYVADSRQWEAGLTLTHTGKKSGLAADEANPDPFVPDSITTFDANFGWFFQNGWQLNLGLFNLTDEDYHQWQVVRGRSNSDPSLDRFTEPGRNARLHIHYRW